MGYIEEVFLKRMKNKDDDPVKITDEIFSLYKQFGEQDYIGEPVSQIEHMAQTAALALDEGYDDEVVLAAFLHDIGHLCVADNLAKSMNGFGNKDHEQLGADFLKSRGFSERILMLVKGHVAAKRYLTFKNPDYYNQLSEASRETLKHQGGVMSPAEAKLFEQDNDAVLLIKMRQWDDSAKQTDLPITALPKLKALMVNHLKKIG